jgi:hypothetical protein
MPVWSRSPRLDDRSLPLGQWPSDLKQKSAAETPRFLLTAAVSPDVPI